MQTLQAARIVSFNCKAGVNSKAHHEDFRQGGVKMFFKVNLLGGMILLLCLTVVPLAGAEQGMKGAKNGESPLSLIVATPEEGFHLAIVLARKGVTETQPDKTVLKKLRPAYAHDPDSLIAASQVIAIHFQTIAAANNYWRDQR
ncbi:hexameric tyrosine-coordinated heme protein [Desulfatitalea alkaliphila]|uniref:Hexameric tyrosine-coordinated heme protein n=1 Tax=Desulfatitalea alkaliphila TaxID=2929485 RepID=A0AA41UJ61_9BACT|nr:hexameric tyrosine-coordinated heme protein [Desulfatitalea alkaliphila]MCJ8499036.1 hexameric tyrosine-coordinated heme protein [Desulfatitalea alkaliphila]